MRKSMVREPSVSCPYADGRERARFFDCASRSGLIVRGRPCFFEERLIRAVCDHRRALVDEWPQTAGMVEMRVRVDDVANRFGGKQLFRLRDDGTTPRFRLRPLDNDDVIAHPDRDVVVVPPVR